MKLPITLCVIKTKTMTIILDYGPKKRALVKKNKNYIALINLNIVIVSTYRFQLVLKNIKMFRSTG